MTNRLPPLNGLRAFEAAGRWLNFRLAADEMGVTQGAVAQQVRGLEDHLGLHLFLRGPKGLSFTDAGRGYHDAVARAFAGLKEATASLRPEPAKVTISVTPSFASKWLIPHLGRFTQAHPDVDLRILATEALSSFHGDGVDLAVRQGMPPFGASLEAHLLFQQDVVAVCAPRLIADEPLPLSDQAFDRLALLHDTHNLWPEFLRAVMGRDPRAGNNRLRFNQTALSLEAALAGQGVALASRFLVARDLAEGRLVQITPGELRAKRDFYLLAPAGARRRDAVANVMDWLIALSGEESRLPAESVSPCPA